MDTPVRRHPNKITLDKCVVEHLGLPTRFYAASFGCPMFEQNAPLKRQQLQRHLTHRPAPTNIFF